jgi:hypothetical protein
MMGSGINKPFDELRSNGLSVCLFGAALSVRQPPNFKHLPSPRKAGLRAGRPNNKQIPTPRIQISNKIVLLIKNCRLDSYSV